MRTPAIMPMSKNAVNFPNNFPLIFAGARSALNALPAGMLTFIPRDLSAITPVACQRFEANGSTIDPSLDDRLPMVIIGFLPHLSASFPAKKLHAIPTNPDMDRIAPIWKVIAPKTSPRKRTPTGAMKPTAKPLVKVVMYRTLMERRICPVSLESSSSLVSVLFKSDLSPLVSLTFHATNPMAITDNKESIKYGIL